MLLLRNTRLWSLHTLLTCYVLARCHRRRRAIITRLVCKAITSTVPYGAKTSTPLTRCKTSEESRKTLYDPKFCVKSKSEVIFSRATRNFELRARTRKTSQASSSLTRPDPTRPNRSQIRAHHRIWTLETRSWTLNTPVQHTQSQKPKVFF